MKFDKGIAPFKRGDRMRMRDHGFKIEHGQVVTADSVKWVESLKEWCVDVKIAGWPTGYRASRFEKVKQEQTMKPFLESYDLKSLPVLNDLRLKIARAHARVQNLEGGRPSSLYEKAIATTEFLNIFKVTSKEALSPPNKAMISEMELIEVLDKVLPKFNCDLDLGQTFHSQEPVWVCGVREGGHDDKPLANGYAICSNPAVAIMQATLRMLDNLIAQKQVERLATNPVSLLMPSREKREAQAALWEMGARKTGKALEIYPDLKVIFADMGVTWKTATEEMEKALYAKQLENARRAVRMFPCNKTPFPKMWRPEFGAVHLENALREREDAIRKLVSSNLIGSGVHETVEAGLKAFRYAILGVNPPGL